MRHIPTHDHPGNRRHRFEDRWLVGRSALRTRPVPSAGFLGIFWESNPSDSQDDGSRDRREMPAELPKRHVRSLVGRARSDSDSPWVTWRLHTLEARMELWQRTSHQGSRRPVGTRRRRRPRPSGSCVSFGLSLGPSTGRSCGWPASSATAPSRCAAGSVRPTSTTD